MSLVHERCSSCGRLLINPERTRCKCKPPVPVGAPTDISSFLIPVKKKYRLTAEETETLKDVFESVRYGNEKTEAIKVRTLQKILKRMGGQDG